DMSSLASPTFELIYRRRFTCVVLGCQEGPHGILSRRRHEPAGRGHGVPYAMTAPPSLRALRPAAGRPGRLGLGVLLFLVLLVFALPTLIRLAAEWPWFNSIGYGRVFTTRLLAGGLLGLVVGAIAFAFLYANLRFAQRGVTPHPVLVRLNPQAAPLDVTRFV